MDEIVKSETFKLATVAAYVPYPWEHAVTWLRVLRPLQQAGLTVLRGSDPSAGIIQPELVSQADAVVIQREFPAYSGSAYAQILQLARAEHKPVIYEIDDLLLELPPEHPDHHIHYYTYALLPMLQAIVEADLVSTTTPTLQAYYRQLNPHTCVLPNYLDDQLWQPPPVIASEARMDFIRKQSQPASEAQQSQATSAATRPPVIASIAKQSQPSPKSTIGYMGSITHVPDLAQITPPLLRLTERFPNQIAFKFWGAPPPPELQAAASVEWVAKELPDYPRFSQEFSQPQCDIFIAPLVSSFFNQCKSAIKYFEYSIQGVPGVYSRLAPYEAVVQHGENGLLAESVDEWETLLAELIENKKLRTTMGQKAQASVLAHWRLSEHAHEWFEAYQAAQMNANAVRNSRFAVRNSQFAIRSKPEAGDSDPIDLFLRLGAQVQAYLEELRAQNARQDQEIEALTDQLRTSQQLLEETAARLGRSEYRLAEIENSESWRLILQIGKIKKLFHG